MARAVGFHVLQSQSLPAQSPGVVRLVIARESLERHETSPPQIIEAGAAAAYAIANPDPEHFATADAQGIIDLSKLTDKRYKWLDDNFPDRSAAIKEKKGRSAPTR